ncbi:MAG: hypothetical protein GEU73_08810 [Chloroflexi bacterium]|nr:hypothetical protein [Chloroflexota bacterium]
MMQCPALAVLALLTCIGNGLAAAPPAVVAPLVEAQVTRVIDGSSLDAVVGGSRIAVAYLGVTTPSPNERCGPEALARNRELAGIRVLLEEDPAHRVDSIGRRLYYAYTPDGRSIDEILVSEGFGRAALNDGRHAVLLAARETEATQGHLGCIWKRATPSGPGPIAP